MNIVRIFVQKENSSYSTIKVTELYQFLLHVNITDNCRSKHNAKE